MYARCLFGDAPFGANDALETLPVGRRVGALALTPVERLAVEMALHEAQERAVLEGELAHLALAWQDAEAIAAIADRL